MIRTILRAALHKLCAAFGSVLTVPLIYGLFVLCFAMTSLILTAQAPEKVTVALVDQCGGPYARRLCDDLLSSAELDVTLFPSVHEAEDALLCGQCEAALTIRDDYDRRILSDDASALIHITEAPDAVSGDLLRETVAGLLLSGRSAARAERALTAEGYDSSLLYTYASAFPLRGSREHTAEKLLRSIGVSAVYASDNGEKTDFYCCFGGVPVYNAILSFTFSDTCLTMLTGTRLFDNAQRASEGDGMDSVSALLRFVEIVRTEGYICSRIDSISAGYSMTVSRSGASELAPVWRIGTDTGVLLIDAGSGEVIK